MLSQKEIELSDGLFKKLQFIFPTISLVEIVENPHEKNGVLMRIIPPIGTEESIVFGEFAAEMTSGILVEHDCDIIISFTGDW